MLSLRVRSSSGHLIEAPDTLATFRRPAGAEIKGNPRLSREQEHLHCALDFRLGWECTLLSAAASCIYTTGLTQQANCFTTSTPTLNFEAFVSSADNLVIGSKLGSSLNFNFMVEEDNVQFPHSGESERGAPNPRTAPWPMVAH